MRKQILILQALYSFIVEDIINKINEIPSEEDIDVILNSPGGSVFAGWTLAAALMERKGKVHIKVRGHAASMAPFLSLLGDTRECLDVTMYMLHRANSYNPDDEEKKLLKTINDAMYKKMKAVVDDEKLKELKGVTVKDIFEAETQTDVWLTAKEAKQVGLVDKVVKLERKEMKAEAELIAAYYKGEKLSSHPSGDHNNSNNNNSKTIEMTIEQIKKEHPAIYAQIIALGVSKEKDRVKAWMAFNDLAPKEVAEGIAGGNDLSQGVMAEMSRKALDASIKAATKNESAGDTQTDPPSGDDGDVDDKSAKALTAFEEEVNASLGLKKEIK